MTQKAGRAGRKQTCRESQGNGREQGNTETPGEPSEGERGKSGSGESAFGTVATQEKSAMGTGVNELVLISVIPVIPVNR